MAVNALVSALGDEITDAHEEIFFLFSHHIPSSNLGFIDPHTNELDLDVGGHTYTVRQSPGVLTSARTGGTTGAVLWKVTPAFASWLASSSNVLFSAGVLSQTAAVVELGCGISALNALALRGAVGSYLLTDQPYVARLVAHNLAENNTSKTSTTRSRTTATRSNTRPKTTTTTTDIRFAALDWELDSAAPLIPKSGVNLIVACDCVYNDTLIGPFIDTCADVCRVRQQYEDLEPTVCLVAQHLRTADVMEAWMEAFLDRFRAWAVPDNMAPMGLRRGDGFVVYVGVLK